MVIYYGDDMFGFHNNISRRVCRAVVAVVAVGAVVAVVVVRHVPSAGVHNLR